MSYLSTTENVGFSGLPQNISDASCASQYKMAVEGVPPAGCSEVNMFMHDNSVDEQTYINHLNDNFYTKFKIDPNELYTFHDSDVIANEITVGHTEDHFMFPDTVDDKGKLLDSPNKDLDLINAFSNGIIKEEIKDVVSNGHYPLSQSSEMQAIHTKVQKAKNQSQIKERVEVVSEVRRPSVQSPKAQNTATIPSSNKNSINSVNTNNVKNAKQSAMETFLDVFKREQGLVEKANVVIKTEPVTTQHMPAKTPVSTPKKASGKSASQNKQRRGRGPAVHEALQRIPSQRRAVAVRNDTWHAPGESLFHCGPLDNKKPARQLQSSSSDDDNMPDFETGCGVACVEESAAETRGARLALRRAALRRHVARAHYALRLTPDHQTHRSLTHIIKKQLNSAGPSCRLPTQTVNHLLGMRGMPSLLSSQERRKLRESGWSGGDSVATEGSSVECSEERCDRHALPCTRYCASHVTLAAEQRLYAACAAVFAGGARCNQPVLPLNVQTPLCVEHAWKRDNYDKLSRDCRPKKSVVRKRVCPTTPRGPRRAKRRRRPPARLRPPSSHSATQSLSELNVCSNSSTYDSSEDAAMGALSESEYSTVVSDSHELEVVGQVPPDDILDPAVLSQIADEAFTEFFNQAEGTASFAESSELAAALEAVLDERGLDERVLDERVLDERVLDERALDIADCVLTHRQTAKMQVPVSMPMEMSSSASS